VSISPPPAMSAVANRTQTPFSRSIDLPSSPPTDIVYNARKHTKYAMSALEFDDVETARRELKAALSTLGLY
jgi:vacuolar protein sorting-associated protein VTA1